jgi:hypothetical protein
MPHWFRSRIHESVAIAALAAASVALHAGWIANLLVVRLAKTDVLSSLYLFVTTVYVVIFAMTLAWLRGRDCSLMRDRIFHFFLASALIFIAMTLPVVYGFSV